jgi:Family of unknown function (DUF6869)
MESINEVADAWIEMTLASRELGGPDKLPAELFDRGWKLNDLVVHDPSTAVEAIAEVTRRFSEADLAREEKTDAQWVLDNLGAGPLETLLATNDKHALRLVEAEAAKDGRFRWALGCCWQNAMSEDVWIRVQRASARSIY